MLLTQIRVSVTKMLLKTSLHLGYGHHGSIYHVLKVCGYGL